MYRLRFESCRFTDYESNLGCLCMYVFRRGWLTPRDKEPCCVRCSHFSTNQSVGWNLKLWTRICILFGRIAENKTAPKRRSIIKPGLASLNLANKIVASPWDNPWFRTPAPSKKTHTWIVFEVMFHRALLNIRMCVGLTYRDPFSSTKNMVASGIQLFEVANSKGLGPAIYYLLLGTISVQWFTRWISKR